MKKTLSNGERLFHLLADLSPDLLAEVMPEVTSPDPSPAPLLYSPKQHVRRICRAIAVYAACVLLLLGAIFYLPKLFDQFHHLFSDPPVTSVPVPPDQPSEYPADYYRTDLIWANEKHDPRRENAIVGQYHTIDFDFTDDESAVYAIYVVSFNGKYISYTKDFKYSGADFEGLNISSQDHYRIKEDDLAHYYAGTRVQIEAYFNYLEEHYTSGEDNKRFHIRLAYQTITPAILDGSWNTEPLRPSRITGFENTIPYPALRNCLSGSTPTPIIPPDATEISFTINTKKHGDSYTAFTHTLLYSAEKPDLAVLINGTWYDLPWKADASSTVTKMEVLKNDSVSVTLSFDGFLLGDLPTGQYRFRLPFEATHTQSGTPTSHGEQTITILFMVSTGDDCIPSDATQGLAYTLLEDGTYSVSASGFLSASDIVIPSVFNHIPVTAIGQNGFSFLESITSVQLPDTMRTIGASAFRWCISMKTINLPDSITTIGTEAFSSCQSLTKIAIPPSVARLEYGVFNDCHGAAVITIPDSVTHIGEQAFHNCYNLTRLTIPASVQYIEKDAFRSCAKLGSITFADPTNWLSSAGPMDVSSPADNATWLVHTAGVLTRGTPQDYYEAPRWSMSDANWNASYDDLEGLQSHYQWIEDYINGNPIIPQWTTEKNQLFYCFYGIADDPENLQEFQRMMVITGYEDENVKVEGHFYVHPSLHLRQDTKITYAQTEHSGIRRTYTIRLNEVVLADVTIWGINPEYDETNQFHLPAMEEIIGVLTRLY